MKEFLRELLAAMLEGPALYFAPVSAAIKAARKHVDHVDN